MIVEVLKATLKLYQRVLEVMPDLATHDQFASLVRYVARPSSPILVEAGGVELDSLRAEQGGGTKEILDSMEKIFFEDPDAYAYMIGQHKFELIHSVPLHRLRFHEVTEVREFDDEGWVSRRHKIDAFQTVQMPRPNDLRSLSVCRGFDQGAERCFSFCAPQLLIA